MPGLLPEEMWSREAEGNGSVDKALAPTVRELLFGSPEHT